MKIAVTGHKGRIGSELVKSGYTPLECDITDFEQTLDTVSSVNPDVIIHCAAATDVGWCEDNEKEAYKINVRGTAHVLESFEGKFIYLSTVHVFNGRKYFAYGERHEPAPVNAYGMTKLAGEMVTRMWETPYTIIRISKAFDYAWMKPTIDFFKPITKPPLGRTIDFPTFIKRSFVYTPHLVKGIRYIAEDNIDVDLVNIAGTDTLSYYDFWLQVARILGFDENRIVARSQEIEDYPRPFRGGLSVRKAKKLGVPLYSAMDGLKSMKEIIK